MKCLSVADPMSPPSAGGVDVDVGAHSLVKCCEGADSMSLPSAGAICGDTFAAVAWCSDHGSRMVALIGARGCGVEVLQ